jgi:ubiquinone/menaquinone biosynthesis C-methylase UbiE
LPRVCTLRRASLSMCRPMMAGPAGGLAFSCRAVISAVEVAPGCRVLHISTETGEAASITLPAGGASGVVIGADIAPAMVIGGRDRLSKPLFCHAAADGRAFPLKSGAFDAIICQLGFAVFSGPSSGVAEFYRMLRARRCAALCVISTPDQAQCPIISRNAQRQISRIELDVPQHHISFSIRV